MPPVGPRDPAVPVDGDFSYTTGAPPPGYPLGDLVGTWTGTGFNQIFLPDFVGVLPSGQPSKFRTMFSKTAETLKFSRNSKCKTRHRQVRHLTTPGLLLLAVGPVPNRGGLQTDIFFDGIEYKQEISDFFSHEGLHVEPGFWLAIPQTVAPNMPPTIVRQGSIPHGNNILLQGSAVTTPGPPTIPDVLTTPTRPDGSFVSNNYLTNSGRIGQLPAGIPSAAMTNPNKVLQDALDATIGTVLETTTITMTSGNAPDGTGISNIPWLQPGAPGTAGSPNNNAAAVQASATFWIEKIQKPNGAIYFQLQYSQVVQLNFGNVNWPHFSVATLKRS